MNDKIRDSWDQDSDDYYQLYMPPHKVDALVKDPTRIFPREVYEMICREIPDLKGKRVCVPSSGDNAAVFGFHLLGAKVTSVDISQRQLYNAQRIAKERGWDIEFICEDSMAFGKIESDAYDLVYTSNGVHVWISDLLGMYRNFSRVLHQGGAYIMFETHPYNRPFDDSGEEIKLIKPYEAVGPFGEVPNYHWRVQDIFNAMNQAGFTIGHMEEFHPRMGDFSSWWYKSPEEAEADHQKKYNWKENRWAALPQWIGFSATK